MQALTKRWLAPWLARIRARRVSRPRPSATSVRIAVDRGHLDTLSHAGDGVVAVKGWCADLGPFNQLRLRLDGELRPPTHVYRVPRPDLEIALGFGRSFDGAVAEWVIGASPAVRHATLVVDGQDACRITVRQPIDMPYGHLHTHEEMLRREHIYSSGLPNQVVSEEVLALARRLPPPVLDFGCGGGALVGALRAAGIEAYGLEVDSARIREHLMEPAKPYVRLYDGSLPSPFADRQFASVTCSEVLEHMPDAHSAVAELTRLASRALFVTVPDMSAIPRGYLHGVVPWHLLEATHVNFFTQHSLQAVLAPYAQRIEISRVGRIECDRLEFYTSLAAVVELGR